ncbi:hypothetical protein D3C81_1910410 [compost metagenome]
MSCTLPTSSRSRSKRKKKKQSELEKSCGNSKSLSRKFVQPERKLPRSANTLQPPCETFRTA